MVLKKAIENGLPALVHQIDNDLNNIFEPILNRQFVKRGKRHFIEIDGQEMEVDMSFSLTMFSRLANPNFAPEL